MCCQLTWKYSWIIAHTRLWKVPKYLRSTENQKKSKFYKYCFVHEEWAILIPQGEKVSTVITLFQCSSTPTVYSFTMWHCIGSIRLFPTCLYFLTNANNFSLLLEHYWLCKHIQYIRHIIHKLLPKGYLNLFMAYEQRIRKYSSRRKIQHYQ